VQLLALVLAISLPMIGVMLFTIYDNAQQRIKEANNTAHVLAMSASTDISRVLASNRDMMVQMAKRPSIRKMSARHCDPVLWDLLGLFPKSANMTVVDINGTAICSAVPQPDGKPVSVAKAPWFKRSLKEDGFVVSDPFFGPITGRWVTVLTYPVRDDEGRKIGFIGLPLDLALYQPNLTNVPLIPGTSIGVISGDGTYVWRNLETEKWVGQNHGQNQTIKNILAGLEEEMEGVGGIRRHYHIVAVKEVPWKVFVGIPSSYIEAQLQAALYRNLLLGMFGLVLILTVVWQIARQISRPIGALANTSRAIRQGDRSARAILDGPPEIVDVAREFNEMLNVRLQSEIALQASQTELVEALKIAQLGYWQYVFQTDEFIFNDQYYSLHQTSAERMGGYQVPASAFIQKLVFDEDRGLVREALQQAASADTPDFTYRFEMRIHCEGSDDTRWVQVLLKIVQDKATGVRHLVGASQNISERKYAELNQLRLNRSLRVLSECNAALVHADDEQQLLAEICRLIVLEGSYPVASVIYPGQGAGEGIVAAQYVAGRADGELAEALAQSAEIIGLMQNGKAHFVRELDASHPSSDCERIATARGCRSLIAFVLRNSKKEVLGVLCIFAERIDAFSTEELDLLQELADDLAYGVNTLRVRIQHAEAEKQLEFLAHHDSLTRLPNRLLLRDRFEQAIAQADRNRSGVAVLFLDLDNFKQVNDSLGHNYGDQLLVKVVERLRGCLRETDTISRQGGDEFVVLLTNLNDLAAISSISQHIIEMFAEPFELESYTLNTTFSLGVSLYPDDGKDFDTLLKNADTAMYQAKDSGRDTYRYFSEKMNIDAQEQLQLQGQLRQAIKNQEFILHYQPQINIASGRIVGAEALIRWMHPETGLMPPDKFIPLAERTGLVIPMGDWVLHEACQQAQIWRAAGNPLVMAVNISALQFKRGNLLDTVTHALKRSGLPPEFLELELTESVLLQDADIAIAMLRKLKAMGVKLSIDDFGTGYSSLAYLKRLAVNKLKIDQSFVRDLHTDEDSIAIARAIVQLGHTLQLTVIAEGVETAEQFAALQEFGCDEVQGYLYSRPVPSAEFEAFCLRAGC
jgi:diguanylate cyclase (GGDEF)-like protein